MAAVKDHLGIVTLLLDNRGNPAIANKEGQTPMDICHDPQVKTALQHWFLHPNESDRQVDAEYLDDSDEEA
jgi:ankyrin repeat protein